MISRECHLICEVCPKLEVVQVDQQTVYYVGESTVHCFYEELYSSLQCIESIQNCIKMGSVTATIPTGHDVKVSRLSITRGLAATPRKPVGPRLNVVLI